MGQIAKLRYNGLKLSVWGPEYSEIREEAKLSGLYKAREPLVLFADDFDAPHAPWPDKRIRNRGEYIAYMRKTALIFVEQDFIHGSHQGDPHLDISVYLFPPRGNEPYAKWKGGIWAEETLAPLRVRGDRWQAKGKVVARFADPMGLFIGEYNPGWQWQGLPKWKSLEGTVVEKVESLDQVLEEAEDLLLRVEEKLDPGGVYALVSYIPRRLAWMGNMGYFFRPLTPCTVVEAELSLRREGRGKRRS